MKITELMTDYEIREYHGYKKTASDKILDKAMLKEAIKNRLALNEQVRLPTGEVVKVSAADLLVDAKLNSDLEHPENIDLVKWVKAAGEEVNASEVTVKGADELFGDIVNK